MGWGGGGEGGGIGNGSGCGVGGTVWSADDDRALQVARRVHTGTIGLNGYLPDPTAPFGGVKASGMGRELGPEGLAAFQQLKSIAWPKPAMMTGRRLRAARGGCMHLGKIAAEQPGKAAVIMAGSRQAISVAALGAAANN